MVVGAGFPLGMRSMSPFDNRLAPACRHLALPVTYLCMRVLCRSRLV